MMRINRLGSCEPRRLAMPLLLLAIISASGCAGKAASPTSRPAEQTAANPSTDPCAMRLHDLAGGLLLHYVQHADLPADLAALESLPGQQDPVPLVCPASELRYVYNPQGILLPERNLRVIIYDATPVHGPVRWALAMDEPQPGVPLVAKVIALPESFFLLRPSE